MTMLRFRGGNVVVGQSIWPDVAIHVEDGRTSSLNRLEGDDRHAVDLAGGWLMPGFIDAQINGGGGVLFNDETNVDGISAIGAAHARFGTTGFLPTLISSGPDKIAQALEAVDAAIDAGVPGVLGVHIEGPFLNPARNGIHDAASLRRLDPETLALLCRPRRGVVMVTLAPELVDFADIRTLGAAGVRVSAGHSEATYAEAIGAFDAGVSAVTHLFNAMPAMRQREPGLAGAALDDPRPWCGVICDGFHVAPAMVRLALRARPADRMMLVTDAMPTVGSNDNTFVLQGRMIHVMDGLCAYEDGTLAGAHLAMSQAVAHVVREIGADPVQAAALAATNPAAFLRCSGDRGTIAAGLRADFAWLDSDFEPVKTFIGGEERDTPEERQRESSHIG